MTETEHWQALNGMIGNRLCALKLNVNYVAGIPDCWLSGTLDDLWMENKRILSVPKVLYVNNLLSVLQSEWLIARHKEGRNVSVLVFSPVGHVFLPGLAWLEPIRREEFMEIAMKRRAIADLLVTRCGEIQVATEGLKSI